MIVQVFPSGPLETNAYVIACPTTRSAAIVDPARGSCDPIISYVEQHHLKVEHILLTHSHWDHIADVAPLKAHYGVPVSVHPEDAKNVEKPGSDWIPRWISIDGVKPDRLLHDGETIKLGNLLLQVIHTPGHSPGGVCFYCPEEAVLIAGDTLFRGSIGNLSLPTAEPERMWPSLKKLSTLPPQTRVFSGHGPATTIGAEDWLPRAEELFGN